MRAVNWTGFAASSRIESHGRRLTRTNCMIAIDTNVFIYRLDLGAGQQARRPKVPRCRSDTDRLALAVGMMRQLRSWQDRGDCAGSAAALPDRVSQVVSTGDAHASGGRSPLDLAGRYSLSHWDSMLLEPVKKRGFPSLHRRHGRTDEL